MAALAPGTHVGPYEVLSPLGAGAMGEVYRARDARLDRDVAPKVLPEALTHDADRLRRFEQEARAAGALNHPNVLAVYDTGTHQDAPYLVFELLQGETLRERLHGAALPVPKAVAYAVQVARGLAAAHDTVSYVLRYAGLLDETGRECDRAITLDPKNFRWRSCALAFMELGRYDRARDFMVLAAGWEWSAGVSAGLLLRENNSAEALRQSRTAGPNRDWLQACLERRPAAERAARARALEAAQDTLASVRGSAEFAAIRKAAMECQQRFLAARAH